MSRTTDTRTIHQTSRLATAGILDKVSDEPGRLLILQLLPGNAGLLEDALPFGRNVLHIKGTGLGVKSYMS